MILVAIRNVKLSLTLDDDYEVQMEDDYNIDEADVVQQLGQSEIFEDLRSVLSAEYGSDSESDSDSSGLNRNILIVTCESFRLPVPFFLSLKNVNLRTSVTNQLKKLSSMSISQSLYTTNNSSSPRINSILFYPPCLLAASLPGHFVVTF